MIALALLLAALQADTMTVAPSLGPAPLPSRLSLEQAAIVYDQCLARAAVRASRTDASDAAIFGLAHADCAPLRAQLLAGRADNAELRRIFAEIDAGKATTFPALTRRIRAQRAGREGQLSGQN